VFVSSQFRYPHYAFHIGVRPLLPYSLGKGLLDPLFWTKDRPNTTRARQRTENKLCISRVKIQFHGLKLHGTYTDRNVKGQDSLTIKTLLTTDITKSVCGCSNERYISVLQHWWITYLYWNIWKLYWTEMWILIPHPSSKYYMQYTEYHFLRLKRWNGIAS